MRITPPAVANVTAQSLQMLALDFCPDWRHGRGHRNECPWATLDAMRATILRLPSPEHHWTKSGVNRSLPRALLAFGRWYQSWHALHQAMRVLRARFVRWQMGEAASGPPVEKHVYSLGSHRVPPPHRS